MVMLVVYCLLALFDFEALGTEVDLAREGALARERMGATGVADREVLLLADALLAGAFFLEPLVAGADFRVLALLLLALLLAVDARLAAALRRRALGDGVDSSSSSSSLSSALSSSSLSPEPYSSSSSSLRQLRADSSVVSVRDLFLPDTPPRGRWEFLVVSPPTIMISDSYSAAPPPPPPLHIIISMEG